MSKFNLVEWRRTQADSIEKLNPPNVGEWNLPEMLRDDANEIERLTAERDRQYDQNVEQIAQIASLQAWQEFVRCNSKDAAHQADEAIALIEQGDRQGEFK